MECSESSQSKSNMASKQAKKKKKKCHVMNECEWVSQG